MPQARKRRVTVVSVRCSREERAHWKGYARERDMQLSAFLRLIANNVTGVNDPPKLDAFDNHDLDGFTKLTHGERLSRAKRARRRLTDSELGIAASVVMCQCCLHGHHLLPHIHRLR